MLALDTNVVVRYLTNDDPEQASRARSLIDGSAVRVPTTVLLETGWVLRGAYGFQLSEIAAAIRRFAGLPTVSLESPELAAQALDWLEQGMDFADAVHLAASTSCDAFVTFDTALAKAARRAGAPPVRAP